MDRKTFRFLMIGAALTLGLAAVLLVVNLTSATATATPAFISGWVRLPNGDRLLEPVIVKLHNPDETVWAEQVVTDTFDIGPVPPGNYILVAYPQPGTEQAATFTRSHPRFISVLLAPINLGEIRLTHPAVVGTVFDPSENPAAGAVVTLRDAAGRVVAHGRANIEGFYKLGGIAAGSYIIEADRPAGQPWIGSVPQPVNVTPVITPVLQDLYLRAANIFGVVQAANAPVRGAQVRLVNAANPREMLTTFSDDSGLFTFGGPDFNGIYGLRAFPPPNRYDLNPSAPLTVVLTPLTPISNVGIVELTPGQKIVTGAVMLEEPFEPLGGGVIIASREGGTGFVTATVSVPGDYELQLTGGWWWIALRPITHANWIVSSPPRLVRFGFTDTVEHRQASFTVLPAVAQLQGIIAAPPDYTFTVRDSLHIEARNDEGRGNDIELVPGAGARQINFALPLRPDRYHLRITPSNPFLAQPPLPTYLVMTITNAGLIRLEPRDSIITGTVKNTTGTGIRDAKVVAWRPYGERHFNINTRPDGHYLLGVTPGRWSVTAIPSPDSPYMPLTQIRDVTVTRDISATNVNFQAITATARILGRLVTPQGRPVFDVDGRAFGRHNTSHRFDTEGPVESGRFNLKAVPGLYRVGVDLPPDSNYIVTGTATVNVVTSTAYVDITVIRKTAHIQADIFGLRTEHLEGEVMVWNPFARLSDTFGPLKRRADIDVIGGLWRIAARLRPEYERDFMIRAPVGVIPVEAGQVVHVPLAATRADAAITGQVIDNNGAPMRRVVVWAEGAQPANDWVRREAFSNAGGYFTLTVPTRSPVVDPFTAPRWITAPVYRVGAVYPYTDGVFIEPPMQIVTAPASGLVFQFRAPDVQITGTLTVITPGLSGEARVTGWSTDGGGVEAVVPMVNSAGVYALPVVSNTVWHLRAVLEQNECGGPGTPGCFYAARAVVTVTNSSVQRDLVLRGPISLPGQKVFAFDATVAQTLELPDGTRIYIPAGALATDGVIILQALPIAHLPNQRHAQPFSFGWALIATDESGNVLSGPFNQDVIITFRYSEADLIREGIDENTLVPAYYSTTTRRWTIPDGYVVDTVNNLISMQVDHFTDFGVLSTPQTELTISHIFLPMVVRNK